MITTNGKRILESGMQIVFFSPKRKRTTEKLQRSSVLFHPSLFLRDTLLFPSRGASLFNNVVCTGYSLSELRDQFPHKRWSKSRMFEENNSKNNSESFIIHFSFFLNSSLKSRVMDSLLPNNVASLVSSLCECVCIVYILPFNNSCYS